MVINMLEVVFSTSAKGSMMAAKNCGGNKILACSIGIIGDIQHMNAEELKNLQGPEDGMPLEGSSRDVVSAGFALDIGRIGNRAGVYEMLIGHGGTPDELQRETEFLKEMDRDIKKLVSAAENGTPIRIWKSNAPFSVCGFYFVCHLLMHIDCEITVITLPEYRVAGSTITSYRDWAEVEHGHLHQFLPLAQSLTKYEKRMFGSRWQELAGENAPLRAVVNGRLISVPENFYDFIICENIPEGEFKMGNLMGSILCKGYLGISDGWLAYRINKMIEGNTLAVISESPDHPYSKTLLKI